MTAQPNGQTLVNGNGIQFEYGHDTAQQQKALQTEQQNPSKKKKKKKKSKKSKPAPLLNADGEELDFDDPDFEYPDSRVLKQNSNGDVIVQSLEPVTKKSVQSTLKSNHTSSASDDLLPKDPIELNRQLKQYWHSLSVQEKKDLLNVERESVFKIMKVQQKITCNCSVCGRKRQIIEGELKKLYDSYFEDIDTHTLLNSDLFDLPADPTTSHLSQHSNQHKHQNQANRLDQHHLPSQNPSFHPHMSGQSDLTRKNGILSVAEDLLQNDGRKFLEMMEKLAESRIQRQAQYLKRPDLMVNFNQIEEEENNDYNSNNNDYEDDNETYENEQSEVPQEELQRQNLSISDINFAVSYDEDSDLDYQLEETDIDDLESEEFWSDEDPMLKDDYLQLIEESREILNEDVANLTGDPEQMLGLQLQRQKQLHEQLQREKLELEQLEEEILNDHSEDFNDEDHAWAEEHDEQYEEEEYDDEEYDGEVGENDEYDHHHSHTHTCGHHHDHSHSHGPDHTDDKDMKEIKALLNEGNLESDEEFEEYSDDAIDEEQQLQEGRAMLQLCTAKMLKQSLIESLKNKRKEETVNALLHELDEEASREKLKEEKKQREKEKKREKKRLIQQQKEEERLRREAEQERLRKEKEEEQRRKVEEGRRRKQEKLEEKRRKDQEIERVKKEKEEKRRQLEEEKRLREEETLRLEKEAQASKEELERQELEQERLKLEEAREIANQERILKQQQLDAKALQEKIVQEEAERASQQDALRALQERQERQQQQQQLPLLQQNLPQQQQPLQFQDILVSQRTSFGYDNKPAVNPLLDNVYQSQTYISSPMSKNSIIPPQNQSAQPLSAPPPGFSLDTQHKHPFVGIAPSQTQNSFFTPRLSETDYISTGTSSPWLSQQQLAPTAFNPLGFDTNRDSFPSQAHQSFSSVPLVDGRNGSGTTSPLNPPSTSQKSFGVTGPSADIDFLSSKLSSTKFDDFLTGSTVWSANPSAGSSEWSNTPLSTSIWGKSPGKNQASTSHSQLGVFNTPLSTAASVPSNDPNTNINQIIQSYQNQIFETYTFAQPRHISNGGYLGIQELYASFNALQSQPINFNLFLSILESPSGKYRVDTIKDDNGTVILVKLSNNTPLDNGFNNSRAGSVFQLNQMNQLNQLDNITETSGFNDRLKGFDSPFSHGSLTWGSTL